MMNTLVEDIIKTTTHRVNKHRQNSETHIDSHGKDKMSMEGGQVTGVV